jgi:hypothetical protein
MAKRGRPRKITYATTTPATAQNGRPAQEGGETTSSYFRKLFNDNPKLLGTRSNEALLTRWLADNPGHKEVPQKTQKILANVKGILRKKARKRGKAKTAEQIAPVSVASAAPKAAVKIAPKNLETLEEQIDDCLTLAKRTDKEGLADVVRLLRSARNSVVWMMGQ